LQGYKSGVNNRKIGLLAPSNQTRTLVLFMCPSASTSLNRRVMVVLYIDYISLLLFILISIITLYEKASLLIQESKNEAKHPTMESFISVITIVNCAYAAGKVFLLEGL